MLAILTWANAGMLAGLAAVSVPIAIHLFNRRRPHTVVFPTIRFLRAAMASQSRVHRLRHLILLLLRCAVVALLAMAFARPQWFESADAAATADRDTVAVLLLDVSASMGYADPLLSPMAEATTRAAAILDGLEPGRGDRANVLLVGLSPQPLQAAPTGNFAVLKQRLGGVAATAERADGSAAIALAAAQFDGFRPSRKELHIISDVQQSNWADADFSPLPRDVHVVVHRIQADKPHPNVVVSGVRADPPRPIVGQPCRIHVQVTNHGAVATSRVVRLGVNGAGDFERKITVLPGASAGAEFDVRFNTLGVQELSATIPADAFAVDDRFHAVVSVAARVPVVLCTDASVEAGATSSYFLARALAPVPAEQATIELRLVTSDRLSAATLHDVEVVLLDAADRLGADASQELYEFLKRGGGVVVFLGPGAGPENLAALRGLASDRQVLPFEPGERVDHPAGGTAAHVVAGDVELHPLLRPFAGAAWHSLEQIHVRRHYTTPTRRRGADIAATLSTGDVALAAAPVGAGTLLVCNVSPDPTFSDLAKRAAFPTLVHEFVRYLRPKQWEVPATYAGMAATGRWTAGELFQDARVVDPADEPVRVSVRREGPAAVVMVPKTTMPGFYRVLMTDQRVESIAVNVDPVESLLTPATEERMAANVAKAAASMVRSTEGSAAVTAEREPTLLWHWVLLGALGMLALEMVCLIVWRR
ncbi:MAG: BatA domain-containing protein [Phycisphaerae bacterium]|nr:BatA domain-containing protein [Phycisphaerae bacterium]